ncbi:MAG: CRISPR-associated endonuclease Cas1 [Candidatus Lokiarchaeota archaeon]|nr:CRISPR-associated endonuclease Cas1 [Candidatus Lokiarchaeota archaeon]
MSRKVLFVILYVQSPGTTLGKSSETIKVIKSGAKPRRFSIRDIEGVIISTKVHVSYDALMLLSEYSIPVIYQKGHKILSYSVPYANHGFVLTRREQMNAYNDSRGGHIAQRIVMGAIDNKIRLLKYTAKNRRSYKPQEAKYLVKVAGILEKKYKEAEQIQIPRKSTFTKPSIPKPVEKIRNKLMGIEGSAAREYFHAFRTLFPKKFNFVGRNRRPPKDPINSLLSFGYTLLQGPVLSGIAICGLEPYAGFLHSDRSGKPSLILDLIEEFRQPVIDRVILRLIGSGEIKNTDFRKEGAFIKLSDIARYKYINAIFKELETKVQKIDGKKLVLQQIIVHQARKFVRYLQGRESEYTTYCFNW